MFVVRQPVGGKPFCSFSDRVKKMRNFIDKKIVTEWPMLKSMPEYQNMKRLEGCVLFLPDFSSVSGTKRLVACIKQLP